MGVTITEWIQAEEEGTPEYLLENYVDRVKERARGIHFLDVLPLSLYMCTCGHMATFL